MRNPLFKTRITEMLGIPPSNPLWRDGPWRFRCEISSGCGQCWGMSFIVGSAYPDPEQFREELRKCRQLAPGKRFGVNLYISSPPNAASRLQEQVRILAEEDVLCVETSGGSPEAILPALRESGIKVLHKVSAVRHARSAERLGVDAMIVVGNDSGGHPGTYGISSMVQAPQASRELSIPLVIGGGMGTGSQLAATLVMGADAILIGTRMLVSEELWIHRQYKDLLVNTTAHTSWAN